MAEKIEHSGIVEKIDGNKAQVKILQTSACAACHAKSMCMAAESSEKIVDAQIMTEMKVGDKVMVFAEKRMGFKAVLIAFVIPFVIMMAVIAIVGVWVKAEWLVALLSIGALAVYCLVVRCFRKKLDSQFHFTAVRSDD